MNILGISAFYHDSAAALVQDGRIAAAAQEERFTRKKHDASFPRHAVQYCLEAAGVDPADLDYVVFYEKPLQKFDRLLETYLAYAPKGFRSFAAALPAWLKQKLHVQKELDSGLGGAYRKRYLFTGHHEAHAASAFFPSPFEEAAILTLDGVGEWDTATIGRGRGNRIETLRSLRFPHSLGLFYSAFTYYTGFRVNSGEYKLMGLAPYGEPRFAELIRERLIDLKPDGSFRLDMRYFGYCDTLRMTNARFDGLFGAPPRRPDEPIRELDLDVAASVQAVTEDVMLAAARHAHDLTGAKRLCLAGGVALNCVGNGRILREGPFEDLWIQPAAGDAGGALGAALFVWHQLLDRPRTPVGDAQAGSLLGPEYDSEAIRTALDGLGAVHHQICDEARLCDEAARLLDGQNVVGWFQGRMEFGPRALGCRSILGDPRSPGMQRTMNLKIKFRESFRPFAPSVLRDAATRYFELDGTQDSPYMLLVAPIREEHRLPAADDAAKGLEKLRVARSTLPAVTHVDCSARVQTVDAVRNARYERLLRAFEARTGCPVLINTSFNVRGQPIVRSPEEAYRCFMGTNMDALVIGDFLLLRTEQPAELDTRSEFADAFERD